MLGILRGSLGQIPKILARQMSGYAGGVPGNNLPWKKGMDNPMRFTAFWLLAGVLGFGAPWLVIRHQLLRNVEETDEDDLDEEPEPKKDKEKGKGEKDEKKK